MEISGGICYPVSRQKRLETRWTGLLGFGKDAAGEKRVVLLPVRDIVPNPNQPRVDFDEYELSLLADSIRQNGILQPLTVRPIGDGGYELIAGERRLRAAAMAGLQRVPCLVRRVDEKTAALFALLENLQRSDLDLFEEAEGLRRLLQFQGMTQAEAAERLGIAQSTLSNKLRLLRLTPEQRGRITAARLTERHARALLRLPPEQRDDALDVIIAKQLTRSETEAMIADLLAPKQPPPERPVRKAAIGDVRFFANSLSRMVDTLVNAGLEAKTHKNETPDYIEYTVRIRKSEARPAPPQDLQLKIC